MNCRYIKENKNPKLCRIAIYSFGNPSWFDLNDTQSQREALLFLYSLRGLLRNSLCVCMISIPSHLYQSNSSFVSRMRNLSDTVISLSSFQGSEVKIPDIYSDFTGVMELKRISGLNMFLNKLPTVLTFLFTRRRKKLYIEELYIPPEQSPHSSHDEKPNQNSKSSDVKTALCSPGSKLDF